MYIGLNFQSGIKLKLGFEYFIIIFDIDIVFNWCSPKLRVCIIYPSLINANSSLDWQMKPQHESKGRGEAMFLNSIYSFLLDIWAEC